MLQRWWDTLRQRIRREPSAERNDVAQAGMSAPHDYEAERDASRHAHMSAEDQAWEAATQQRDQASQTSGERPADAAPPPTRHDQ
jgi:hypothetical protein